MATKHASLVSGGRRQKVVIEYKDDGGPEWWVMHDSGQVEVFDTAEWALKAVQKKAGRGNKTITITRIEWRNVPDGFTPPAGE